MPNHKPLKIIHLISDISRINFGVWNVVIATFSHLRDMGHEPEIWYPETGEKVPDEIKPFTMKRMEGGLRDAQSQIKNRIPQIVNQNNIFISHGTWSWATKTGYHAKKYGFPWIAVPHGMLESWAMQQNKFKKKLYFNFFEKRYLKKADAIMAVGKPESENLKKWFLNVHHIPNGIIPVESYISKSVNPNEIDTDDPAPNPSINQSADQPDYRSTHLRNHPITFLFLGRLHHKKGVLPLVKAWLSSSLHGDERYKLVIAGPDEGELPGLRAVLTAGSVKFYSSFEHQASNIIIPGPVYGIEKQNFLLQSTFFILPSQSEGFPTSILEAMTHGCIPVFTEGCNFPEAFEAGVGVKVEFNERDIKNKLEELAAWPEKKRVELSKRAKDFVDRNYNWKDITERQAALYNEVIDRNREENNEK